MKKSGVREPSESPWAAPVVFVRKKDGTLRYCIEGGDKEGQLPPTKHARLSGKSIWGKIFLLNGQFWLLAGEVD